MLNTYAKIWADSNFSAETDSLRIKYDLSSDARSKFTRMESCDAKKDRDHTFSELHSDQNLTKKKTVEIKSLKTSEASLASTATSADNSECNSNLEEKCTLSET